MNWSFWLIGFAIAVFTGSAGVLLLATVRPEWSVRRRRITASSVLPFVTVLATLLGILFISSSDHGQGERMEDLAIAALATIGGAFALLAFVGGVAGATLASRRRSR